MELALWFHDAVYDPKAGDNEERSAAMAEQCLEGCKVGGPLVSAVVALVMVTKKHEVGANQDARLVRDVDLSILGRDKCRFAEYEEQIRREYAWVPEAVFSLKRAGILQRFLDHDQIFVTDFFRDRYERQARRNLEGSIARLRGLSA